jgi:hypothetical protein
MLFVNRIQPQDIVWRIDIKDLIYSVVLPGYKRRMKAGLMKQFRVVEQDKEK